MTMPVDRGIMHESVDVRATAQRDGQGRERADAPISALSSPSSSRLPSSPANALTAPLSPPIASLARLVNAMSTVGPLTPSRTTFSPTQTTLPLSSVASAYSGRRPHERNRRLTVPG